MVREYPFKWVDIQEEERKAAMPAGFVDYVRSEPGNVWLPKNIEKIAEKIYNFEIRSDDVWILTYPKCGTTWTQDLCWHIANNVDIEGSKELLYARSPYLEMQAVIPEKSKPFVIAAAPPDKRELVEAAKFNSVEYADKLKSPRVIKCHLPLSMLPPELFTTKGCKVIYVCRNPKDTCVSYYHHHMSMFQGYKETFDHFEKMFMQGNVAYGSYWYHLKDALKYQHHSNFKMVWFEDMKKDLISVIKDMSKFLGYHLTELKVLTLDDHLYIGNIRKHAAGSMSMSPDMMNKFFRKGLVGDWKNYFSGEKLEEWDKWIQQQLEGTSLKIAYD